jgi:chemotaxis signal transduction protein
MNEPHDNVLPDWLTNLPPEANESLEQTWITPLAHHVASVPVPPVSAEKPRLGGELPDWLLDAPLDGEMPSTVHLPVGTALASLAAPAPAPDATESLDLPDWLAGVEVDTSLTTTANEFALTEPTREFTLQDDVRAFAEESLDTLLETPLPDFTPRVVPPASVEPDVPDFAALDELLSDRRRQVHAELATLGLMSASERTTVSLDNQYIVFSLGALNYAVPMRQVREVATMPNLTSVPNSPAWLLGIANLRGDLVAHVDLRRFFGLVDNPDASSRVAIVQSSTGQTRAGLCVDRVMGLRRLSVDNPESVDPRVAGAGYLTSRVPFEQGVVFLLDVDALLASQKMCQYDVA